MADEMRPFAVEELCVRKIQPQWQMPAAVFIGDEFALKTRNKTFSRLAFAGEWKFDGPALRHFIDVCNFEFRHAAILCRENFFSTMDEHG